MSQIKIFVSHRTDIQSYLVENDIYCNMRCGAVFDDNASDIPGDDSLDNISHKKPNYSEFTVQYWAWKNEKADYYGLCHYRRYLSFNTRKRFRTDDRYTVNYPILSEFSSKKFKLNDKKRISNYISNYDIVVNEPSDVRLVDTPDGIKDNVFNHWLAYTTEFIDKEIFLELKQIIKEAEPTYYESAMEYFAQVFHRGFNCYVLRKDLFFEMCRFQFNILDEIEKRYDVSALDEKFQRTPGYVGEILYGIYIYHLQKQNKYRIAELQLVFFDSTLKESKFKTFKRYIFFFFKEGSVKLFPYKSKRREWLKKIGKSVLKL